MTRPDFDIINSLKRLEAYVPERWDLGLERLYALLESLDNPQNKIPPAFHIAGTNGKGSTGAMLRFIFEQSGKTVHVYTSPHLIRFHERIRVAGQLIDDAMLEYVLDDIERALDKRPITFFELTTCLAFEAFARIPADYSVIETGLGGRLDATNTLRSPLCSIITRISYDHQDWLGDSLYHIAGEKAGIMKPNVPCVIGYQADDTLYDFFSEKAHQAGSIPYIYGRDWHIEPSPKSGMDYVSRQGRIPLPQPNLAGIHQYYNAGNALAALDVLGMLDDYRPSFDRAMRAIEWPARLQPITQGPLFEMLPPGSELIVDGGHNDSAADALVEFVKNYKKTKPCPVYLIWGMTPNKNHTDFIQRLSPHIDRLYFYQGHDRDKPPRINLQKAKHTLVSKEILIKAAESIPTLAGGMDTACGDEWPAILSAITEASKGQAGMVLVAGSLYMAGDFLKDNAMVIR